MRTAYGLAAIAVLSLCGSAAIAQTSTTQDTDARMQRFEQRLNEMERKHQADIRVRDAEIARLKAQLPTQPSPPTTRTDGIEKTKQDILRNIEKREESPLTLRTPANFNPDIAVIGDFRGNVSSNNDNPARNRFDTGTLELDLRAAVHPRADGVAIIHFGREVHDPLFRDHQHLDDGADHDHEHEAGEVEHHIELEEAYLFLHDFGVPNLTATLGRYKVPFGRWNVLHMHDWPTVNNALVMDSFFGHEGYGDAGLSLSYVIPPRLVGNSYIEVIGSILTGEGGDHGIVFNNDALVASPAFGMRAKWNHDITSNWNLELGGSWLSGKRSNDSRQNANVFGMDITVVHTDPTGRFNNRLFQAEVLKGDVDTSRTDTQHAWGGYLLGQQQLDRDWYIGCRLDWTQNALDDKQEVWGVSPYLTWYWSEFLRFRVEYQHKQGDAPKEDTLSFQCTWVFGAHPPHPYWVMR